jgi:hypothetical protein
MLQQFLHGDLSQNTCCLGQMPCSGHCGESKCPALCLVCESCLCFTLSVASTRFAIQDEQALANTSCDNCIIGTMVALQQLACICQILAICFPELDNMADCIVCLSDICFCATCACMQAQHKSQLDYRDENFGTADTPPPGPMDVPPPQSMKAQPGYPANRGQQQPQPQLQYYDTQPPPQQQMQHPQRK